MNIYEDKYLREKVNCIIARLKEGKVVITAHKDGSGFLAREDLEYNFDHSFWRGFRTVSSQHVVIASLNPVKVQAIQSGFQQLFPDTEFSWQAVIVPSGVSAQPVGDIETWQGAANRVMYAQNQNPEAEYWAAIEGGVQFDADNAMSAFAWVVVHSRAAQLTGKARSAAFYLPPAIAKLVQGGMELGDADDIIFGQSNSKQKNGAVGLLTGDLIDRTYLYLPAVILALIPFRNPHLFPGP